MQMQNLEGIFWPTQDGAHTHFSLLPGAAENSGHDIKTLKGGEKVNTNFVSFCGVCIFWPLCMACGILFP